MNASSELSKKYFKKMNASPIYNFGRRIGSGKRYSIYTLGLIVKKSFFPFSSVFRPTVYYLLN